MQVERRRMGQRPRSNETHMLCFSKYQLKERERERERENVSRRRALHHRESA